MTRRAFIRNTTSVLVSLAQVANAQSARRVFRIGYIGLSAPPPLEPDPNWEAFGSEMRTRGYVDGKSYVLKRLYIEGREERIPHLVAELIDTNVDVLIASHTDAIRAAKQATATIPIVMAGVANPELTGLVESLARPGGNVTGVSNMFGDSAPKIIELFKEALPNASRLGVITGSPTLGDLPASSPHVTAHDAFVAAARRLRVTLIHEPVVGGVAIEAALGAVVRQHAEALYVSQGLLAHRVKVGDFSIAQRLPLFTRSPHWPSTFLSYGVYWPDIFRLVARAVTQILDGKKPAELPVQQPTKYHVVVNLKIARALGISVPRSLLVRADEIVE